MNDEKTAKRNLLLRFNAMHSVCLMSWSDCAAVYEAETGEQIKPDALRMRVKRAITDKNHVHITELPTKIVVSMEELSMKNCLVCAIEKVWTRLKRFFGFGKENA